MQIVVNIDETIFKRARYEYYGENEVNHSLVNEILISVINGTILPKGHGRLGDLDELEQRISNFVEHDAKITDEYTVVRQRFIVDGIRQTPTIIKADKEN